MYKLYFLETLGTRGIQNQHNKSARIAWLAMVYSTKKSISSLEHEGNIKLSTLEWLSLRFSFDTFLSFKIVFNLVLEYAWSESRRLVRINIFMTMICAFDRPVMAAAQCTMLHQRSQLPELTTANSLVVQPPIPKALQPCNQRASSKMKLAHENDISLRPPATRVDTL